MNLSQGARVCIDCQQILQSGNGSGIVAHALPPRCPPCWRFWKALAHQADVDRAAEAARRGGGPGCCGEEGLDRFEWDVPAVALLGPVAGRGRAFPLIFQTDRSVCRIVKEQT